MHSLNRWRWLLFLLMNWDIGPTGIPQDNFSLLKYCTLQYHIDNRSTCSLSSLHSQHSSRMGVYIVHSGLQINQPWSDYCYSTMSGNRSTMSFNGSCRSTVGETNTAPVCSPHFFPWVWHLDQFAYKLGYKDELARALIRLQIKNLSAMDTDWLYSAYNHSHPILVERLRALGYKGGENIFKDEKNENDKIE